MDAAQMAEHTAQPNEFNPILGIEELPAVRRKEPATTSHRAYLDAREEHRALGQ